MIPLGYIVLLLYVAVLLSPQTYHTLYGGHSTVHGDQINKCTDHLHIKVAIDRDGSNVPIVFGSSVSAKEMKSHGPYI